MGQKIFLLISCVLLLNCSLRTYENQPTYELEVNETVEIYYSTNSCCNYCFTESQNLKHIEYLKEITVDSGPRDCAGCNFTAAFVFKAISPGRDTVRLRFSEASRPCEEVEVPTEEFIVVVK